MNFKTTFAMGVFLAALVALYAVMRSAPKPAESRPTTAITPTPSPTTHDLLEKKLGDVVKVVCQMKGKEAWTFEKKGPTEGTGAATWRMTSPKDVAVASYEVDKFGRELGRLQYEVSYKPGEPGGVTPLDAGLAPPEATVTLTDGSGATATVEIGKPASENETYVRLAGDDRICVGKANLRHLWKTKALEYRDQQLWNFAPENVTRVEVIDRSAAGASGSFAFAKDGTKWMMESPVSARATGKVDELLRTISRLRVTQWQDDSREKLGVYGLDPDVLTVRVTVEEKVAAKKDESKPEKEEAEGEGKEAKEETPEIKKTLYELHVADRSPIGEDTKVFVRAGDESAVATLMKATTDKFKPVMSEWRDMKITTANVDAATHIELAGPGRTAALALKDGKWSFDGDGGRAEDSSVKELLKAVKDLNAVVFVEADSAEAASYGFSQPQAEIRLTVPGIEGVDRVSIGSYTDEKAKLMAYVRHNDLSSIGKVRSADIAPLLRAPSAYRDRTVFDLPPIQLQKIVLTRDDRLAGGKATMAFDRAADGWSMTAPVTAPVRLDRVDKLVQSVGDLRAAAIASESDEASAYGLHSPSAGIVITDQPPVEHRIEQPAAEGEPAQPVEVVPPPVPYELAVAEHDGKFYAKRSDKPTIYEISADFYKRLFDEYRTTEVLTFDDAKVRQLSIRQGDQTHLFVKADGRWTYQAEPDLPLDSKKVDNLLLQVKDLKTERYVRNAADDLGQFGLSTPHHEVSVTLDDGTRRVLHVSQQTNDHETDKGRYACVDDQHDVFLLTADMLKRVEVSLPDLEKH
jgi:hypothetical protein